MAMAVVAGHGPMIAVQADVLSAQCCVERASSSGSDGVVLGRGAAVRTKTIARIGRSAGFGCSAAEAEAVSSSYSTSCRMQRMTMTRSSRGSGRQEALRSRQQSDIIVGGGGADASTGEEEALGSFWDRLQLAWRVLIGAPNEAQATKKRFSRLLVRDRGFNSTNLSRLYNAAKGAIKEHVELEGDEDTEVTAVVDRLGELRLDFRVKRVKSVLRDEPFSDSVLPDVEPSLPISGETLWEGSSRARRDAEVRVGGALDEPIQNSALPGQLQEQSTASHDLKSRVRFALDRPFPSFRVPGDEEPIVSTSGGYLWEDNGASQDLEIVIGAANLKSSSLGGALDEPFPNSVLLDDEPSLSISGDQMWIDSKFSQGIEDQVGGASTLNSSAIAGGLDEPFPNSIFPYVKPIMSINQSLKDSRAAQDRDLHIGEASNLISTVKVDVDSDGVWYTFRFIEAKAGQTVGATKMDVDSDNKHL